MTTDPDAWMTDSVDIDRPNAARMYDYYLGGSHNFAVDRDAADQVIAVAPEVVGAARANRAFLGRAVRHALDHGIRQFLDLGSGLPTVGNVHQLVHDVDPSGRVVYVDVEPVAVSYATLLLRQTPTVGVIRADLRDTDAILNHEVTQRLLDFTRPVCVLLVSVLHFVDGDIDRPIAALRERTCPGSVLAISHATHPDPRHAERADAVDQVYSRTSTPIRHRSREEIAALFTGFDLVAPNPDAGDQPASLVPVEQWRPPPGGGHNRADPVEPPSYAGFLAGVGHKPYPLTEVPAAVHRVKAHNTPTDRRRGTAALATAGLAAQRTHTAQCGQSWTAGAMTAAQMPCDDNRRSA